MDLQTNVRAFFREFSLKDQEVFYWIFKDFFSQEPKGQLMYNFK